MIKSSGKKKLKTDSNLESAKKSKSELNEKTTNRRVPNKGTTLIFLASEIMPFRRSMSGVYTLKLERSFVIMFFEASNTRSRSPCGKRLGGGCLV